MDIRLRLARMPDVAALNALIAYSARALSLGFYSPAQIDAAIRYVFGVDTTLVVDGTYFVAESGTTLVGCGGWSRRRTLFGSDARAERDESWLDPRTDAAKIRAFFVDPAYARQGLGRAILERSEAEARQAGFSSLTLMATLPGVPFYERQGYVAGPAINFPLPGGLEIRFVPMSKQAQC